MVQSSDSGIFKNLLSPSGAIVPTITNQVPPSERWLNRVAAGFLKIYFRHLAIDCLTTAPLSSDQVHNQVRSDFFIAI